MKVIRYVLCSILTALCCFAAMVPQWAYAGGAEPIVLQLRWDHQFQFAGYYAAQWLGYYADEGLDVEIRSAFADGEILDAVFEVENGRAQFGVGAANLLIAQDNGKNLSLVASFFQRSAVNYCTLTDNLGNTVFDLSQMNIARRPGDLLDLELQALLYNEGITPFAETTSNIVRDFTLEDLTSGHYEVVPQFLGQISYTAQKSDIPIKVIRPADYGVDFYGDTLFTSGALAKSNPDLVERFRKASIKGWQYALENPEEIISRIVTTYSPDSATPLQLKELSDFNRFQAESVAELTHYPIVQIGNINPSRWGKMASVMNSLGMISSLPDLNEMIFDFNRVRMDRLQETRRNVTLGLGLLISCITLLFLAYLKWRNTLLQNEIQVREIAERQLQMSNSRYETIFRSSVLGITVTDEQGNIQHVNDAWCRMTGLCSEELCSMNINDLIAPESSGMDVQQLQDLKNGHITSYSMEKKYLRRPSESDSRAFFYGKMVLTKIWDMATDSTLTMSMVTDITRDVMESEAIHRSEMRFRRIIGKVAREIEGLDFPETSARTSAPMNLEAINLELEKLFNHELQENRKKDALISYQSRMAAMGEMIGNIAHQWRQPLNTLKLVLLNLKDSGYDPEYAEQAYIKANSLIRRMSETIDDFRYFSKPRQEPAVFTVQSAMKSVLGLMDEHLRISGITVQADYSDLPALFGIENQISHILFNLFSNSVDALKKCPPGSPRIIRLWGQTEGNNAIMWVSDNGPGISKAFHDKIFNMYFSTKEREGGTGLGLHMAKAIIESSFNGSIRLIDTAQGCTFEIQIPYDERLVISNDPIAE